MPLFAAITRSVTALSNQAHQYSESVCLPSTNDGSQATNFLPPTPVSVRMPLASQGKQGVPPLPAQLEVRLQNPETVVSCLRMELALAHVRKDWSAVREIEQTIDRTQKEVRTNNYLAVVESLAAVFNFVYVSSGTRSLQRNPDDAIRIGMAEDHEQTHIATTEFFNTLYALSKATELEGFLPQNMQHLHTLDGTARGSMVVSKSWLTAEERARAERFGITQIALNQAGGSLNRDIPSFGADLRLLVNDDLEAQENHRRAVAFGDRQINPFPVSRPIWKVCEQILNLVRQDHSATPFIQLDSSVPSFMDDLATRLYGSIDNCVIGFQFGATHFFDDLLIVLPERATVGGFLGPQMDAVVISRSIDARHPLSNAGAYSKFCLPTHPHHLPHKQELMGNDG